MKKIIILISLFLFSVVNATGHLSEKDKKSTLKWIYFLPYCYPDVLSSSDLV